MAKTINAATGINAVSLHQSTLGLLLHRFVFFVFFSRNFHLKFEMEAKEKSPSSNISLLVMALILFWKLATLRLTVCGEKKKKS